MLNEYFNKVIIDDSWYLLSDDDVILNGDALRINEDDWTIVTTSNNITTLGKLNNSSRNFKFKVARKLTPIFMSFNLIKWKPNFSFLIGLRVKQADKIISEIGYSIRFYSIGEKPRKRETDHKLVHIVLDEGVVVGFLE